MRAIVSHSTVIASELTAPRVLAAIAAAVLLLFGPLAAQEPAPTFRSAVDLVTLDVSVLDRNRRPVKGLTADDFTVLEDGKPQPVMAFNAVDLPDESAPSAPWLRDVAPDVVSNEREARRIVVIVMDDANVSLDDGHATAARQIGHAVVDQLRTDDLGGVTFTDQGRWQSLTADRARLGAAIDSFTAHPDVETSPLEASYRSERQALGGVTSATPPSICARTGKSLGTGGCVIATLNAVARALASAPQGRKTVVYIGNGIPYDFSMNDARGWHLPGQDIAELQALLRSFQEANVNVYTFDPCGVKCGILGPQQDWLRLMAEETGGRATLATNAPTERVPQIFVENSSYYLLGFNSSNPAADGRFRRIEVRVNRPDVEVHTRSGYYAPLASKGRAAKVVEPSPLDRALGQSVPGGTLPLAMTVAPISSQGARESVLAITVALREPLPPGRHTIELVTTALDAACPECTRQTQRQTLLFVAATGPHAAAQTYEMLSRLSVKPGRYNVRAAATLDDRSGTVFADADVPNASKDTLSVSGLVMNVTPPALTAQARLLANDLPLVPSATRDFRPGMKATAFVRVTEGGSSALSPVRVVSTIRNEMNGVEFERTTTLAPSSFGARRSTDYRLELPVDSLTPGSHLLTLELSVGQNVVTRDARLTIK